MSTPAPKAITAAMTTRGMRTFHAMAAPTTSALPESRPHPPACAHTGTAAIVIT